MLSSSCFKWLCAATSQQMCIGTCVLLPGCKEHTRGKTERICTTNECTRHGSRLFSYIKSKNMHGISHGLMSCFICFLCTDSNFFNSCHFYCVLENADIHTRKKFYLLCIYFVENIFHKKSCDRCSVL